MLTAIDTEEHIWRVIVKPDTETTLSDGTKTITTHPGIVSLVKGEYGARLADFTLSEARDFARSFMDAVDAAIAAEDENNDPSTKLFGH